VLFYKRDNRNGITKLLNFRLRPKAVDVDTSKYIDFNRNLDDFISVNLYRQYGSNSE